MEILPFDLKSLDDNSKYEQLINYTHTVQTRVHTLTHTNHINRVSFVRLSKVDILSQNTLSDNSFSANA